MTKAAFFFLSLCAVVPLSAQCVPGTNGALSFDGGDAVNLGNPAAMTGIGTGAFTVEAWINTPPFSGRRQIFTFGNAGLNQGAWFYVDVLGHLAYDRSNVPCITSTATVDDGAWRHVAVVRSGATETIYIDGVAAGSNTVLPACNVQPGGAFVGKAIAGSGFTWDFIGSMDEVRFWNVARTAAQISANRFSGLSGSESGLVGYWRFDESSGQTTLNVATTGPALDGVLGATVAVAGDDPSRTTLGAPILYCGSGVGAANSANARLEINGVGVGTLPGPYLVNAAPGAMLTFSWHGAPNAPLILLASSVLNPGIVPFCSTPSNVLDLGTPPFFSDVLFVFNGYSPPDSWFFKLGATGAAVQTFSVPMLPTGVLANLQGAVDQSAAGNPCGIGVALTASFQIAIL